MIDRDVLPARFSDFGAGGLAAALIGAYLLFGEPFAGYALHRSFEAITPRNSRARAWLYRRILLLEWVLLALCGAVLVLSGLPWRALGLRAPDGVLGWSLTAAAVLLGLLAMVFTARAMRDLRAEPDGSARAVGPESVVAMLPRTPRDRQLFGAVAVTAGIAEEFVYRGFLIALIAALAPGFPVPVVVLLAAAVFALGHAYQGPQGIVVTLVFGAALGALYVISGSLLAPMLLHMLIDLRAIALGRAVGAGPPRRTA